MRFDYPLISKPLKDIKSIFVSKVACGLEHALFLTSSGFVYSMGKNDYGQLGRENEDIDPSAGDIDEERS